MLNLTRGLKVSTGVKQISVADLDSKKNSKIFMLLYYGIQVI